MPKNISGSKRGGAAGSAVRRSKRPAKNMLEAIREVGDEAFGNVYRLALEREALRRQGKEPPPIEGIPEPEQDW